MGADIDLYEPCLGNASCRFNDSGNKHSVVIKSPRPLKAAEIVIADLRAGFSQLIAAVNAKGQSATKAVEERDRDYEQLDVALERLGARIQRQENCRSLGSATS